jgi:uncharacterized oligopeptide transporter (OPT) family protein
MSEGVEATGADTTEDPERRWLREVYQGDDARQLTVRAAVLGMILGGIMSFSNLVIALKTGWSFGVTITAGILAFVLSKGLHRIGVFKTPFGMLENNAMQSVASAAGYMTGGGTAAAIPALMMVNHASLPGHVMFLWITTIAMLGVFMAIPMKRQMINQEGLKFPSGIAAAETLRGLYPDEAAALDARKVTEVKVTEVKVGEGVHREASVRVEAAGGTNNTAAAGRWLLNAMAVGALWTWLREAKARWQVWFNIPEMLEFPGLKMHGVALKKWSISFDTSLLLMAAGAIMGWRSAWTMMIGATANYLVLAPYGHSIGAFTEIKYKNIVGWTVWLGSPMLLTSGLLSFAFSWRQVARAFADLGRLFGKKADSNDPMTRVEVPMAWFLGGVVALTPFVALFGWMFFGIAWWMSLICVALSFFIAIVASRATGETDITPTGALAKITQIVSGVLAPGSVTTNLMTASMGSGVAIHAADLLTDLKSGYLLGAKPRQQFLAQFFGVMAGSVCVVWAFQQMVPDWTVLGTDRIPAPGAIGWKAVSEVLAQGLNRLPESARTLALIGAIAGIALVLVERALPAKAKRFMPSATGLGLAFTLPFSNALSMFIGALVALGVEKKYSKDQAERWLIPISSGIIAGESLMEIVVRVLVNFHVLTE